jgi:tRNA/tmRNA/rRNA uracil-C5-methylase (TrmA/RlmC/RlmD family)
MTERKRNPLQIGQILKVEIEKVAHGGHFIARHEGAVLFVRHAIPGELVEVEITGIEKSFARADVIAVLEASPSRIEPACQYARAKGCGGCDFQHIDYAKQRELKSDVIAEQFARIAKMEVEIEVEEVSTPLHWRTRFAATSNGFGEIGFRGQRSHDVISIKSCPVLIPEIDIETLPADLIPASSRIEVSLSSNGERTVATSPQRTDRKNRAPEMKVVEGEEILHYEVNNFKYQVSQSSFWQSNINAPQTLVNAVLNFVQFKAGEHLLDLYGGVGLFAGAVIELLGPGGRIDIVEASRSATRDAEVNFAEYENVKIHTGDVEKELKKFKRADVVVLDPPRTGAGSSTITSITAIAPRAIIYVACDPAALARDTAYLSEAGYALTSIRAFDLFPMTHHIESVALYTPRKVS